MSTYSLETTPTADVSGFDPAMQARVREQKVCVRTPPPPPPRRTGRRYPHAKPMQSMQCVCKGYALYVMPRSIRRLDTRPAKRTGFGRVVYSGTKDTKCHIRSDALRSFPHSTYRRADLAGVEIRSLLLVVLYSYTGRRLHTPRRGGSEALTVFGIDVRTSDCAISTPYIEAAWR